MVLESVIVDVLNKFLGEYVASVDRKQLKVAFGEWQIFSKIFSFILLLLFTQLSGSNLVTLYLRLNKQC